VPGGPLLVLFVDQPRARLSHAERQPDVRLADAVVVGDVAIGLTAWVFMRNEFASVSPGTTVYDARLLAPDHPGRWSRRPAQTYTPARY